MILGIDVSPAVREYKTGTEWYTIHLVRALKTIIPQDVRVILYTPRALDKALIQVPAHWEVKVLPWLFSHGWASLRLAFECVMRPPDVFFSPGRSIPALIAWLAYGKKIKIITTIHDNAFDVCPFVYSWRHCRHLRRITRRALRCATLVFVPSHTVFHDIETFYPNHRARMVVVPHGVDDIFFTASVEDINRVHTRYGLPKQYCIVVGRLECKKQSSELARIFLSLIEQQRIPADVGFVFVGTPGYGWNASLYQHASIQALDRFLIIPNAAQSDMPALIAGADALILWSIYEGFGMPATEAMAVGTPVIVSTGGALPEVVGDAGMIIPSHESSMLGEAIRHLYYEPELTVHYQTKGYHRVASLHWNDVAQKIWESIARIRS